MNSRLKTSAQDDEQITRGDLHRLIRAIEEAAQVGHALAETIEELRTDIVHDLRRLIDRMDEPRITQETLAESPGCVCDVCDKEVPLEQARKEGWTDLGRWMGGGKAAFLGICPAHSEKAPEQPKVERPKRTKRAELFD